MMNFNDDELNIPIQTNLIEDLREAVRLKYTCVVYGNAGKTVLVQRVFPDVVVCDAREITDPKILSGCYTVKDGEIEFTAGILIDTLRAGRPLCIKRVDRNSRLLHHILPVISDNRITATSGEVVNASPGFVLIMTASEPFSLHGTELIGPVQYSTGSLLNTFGCREELLTIFKRLNTTEDCIFRRGGECTMMCPRMPQETNCGCKEFPYSKDNKVLCSFHFRALCRLRHSISSLCSCSGSILESNLNRLVLYQAVMNHLLWHDSDELRELLVASKEPSRLASTSLAATDAAEKMLRALMANIRVRCPTLLVGETGAGKTALVQYLAENAEQLLGFKTSLRVMNLSSSTDTSELLGGFQSIDLDAEIRGLFQQLRRRLPKCTDRTQLLEEILSIDPNNSRARLLLRILKSKAPFYFREGVLARAMREGTWLLLDEINLAPPELLDMLDAVLARRTLMLHESGMAPVEISHSFAIFGCMNPAGDAGKKPFESSAFSRLDFPDFSSRPACVRAVVELLARNRLNLTNNIASFYCAFRAAVRSHEYTNVLEPVVSGRTLCRAVRLMLRLQQEGFTDPIFRAFSLLFFTQLDIPSRGKALTLFKQHFGDASLDSTRVKRACPETLPGFVVTPSIELILADVELAVEAGLPVLLQGDTSTGKTSLVMGLAAKLGRRVVRINNHAQTEPADYLGHYATDSGRIVLRRGPLLRAMEMGWWVILDELNLAPSEVLEVLNRLLDDNREIYLPEVDETVRPNPSFALFATQNINYSGRRGLARSFRNRFVEICFGEKPLSELKEILSVRCQLPDGFVTRMVDTYAALRAERSFNALITLRDLFRWAGRKPTGYAELYEVGLELLSARQRDTRERNKIKDVLLRIFKDKLRNYTPKNDLIFESSAAGPLVMTPSYMRLTGMVRRAWEAGEAVLLVGPTGLGKTRTLQAVADMLGTRLVTVNMHAGSENADFVGHQSLADGNIIWKDGPLVQAMRDGSAFLIDEINLAEDAVLERLNSLLEDQRTLFVPEIDREFVAHPGLRIAATMNPGGEVGKRELSPALRNRFTEIYFDVDADERLDVFRGLCAQMPVTLRHDSLQFYLERLAKSGSSSIRLLELAASLIRILEMGPEHECNSPCRVVDAIDRELIWAEVADLIKPDDQLLGLPDDQPLGFIGQPQNSRRHAGLSSSGLYSPPYLFRTESTPNFVLDSPATIQNLHRVLRGLVLMRPLLLTGEPGVGKSSLIALLASLAGRSLFRINLSEQTELSDLLGTYVPSGSSIRFVAGPLVIAIRTGGWVLLDELNLCTQSVIEGLNSLLDHRRSLLVEGSTVEMHPDSLIFGSMNPPDEFNGRKPLPRSFIDRFVTVKMVPYGPADIKSILSSRFGTHWLFDSSLSLRQNVFANQTVQPSFPVYSACSNRFVLSDLVFNACLSNSNVSSYVLVHSQLPQLDLLLRAFHCSLPVLLTGSIGRRALLRFVSHLCGLPLLFIDCSPETDTSDLLGQFHKSQSGSSLFEWRDSPFVSALQSGSLIVFSHPEFVDRPVFDRLAGLFESDRHLVLYESGSVVPLVIHPSSRLVLLADDSLSLSSPLRDRCLSIHLSSCYSLLDIQRICCSRLFSLDFDSSSFNLLCFDSLSLIDKAILLSQLAVPVLPSFNLDRTLRECSSHFHPHLLAHPCLVPNLICDDLLNSFFSFSSCSLRFVDSSLLSLYNFVSLFSMPLPSSYSSRIDMLVPTGPIPLVKLVDMFVVGCVNSPRNIRSFKLGLLSNLRNCHLGDISVLSEYFSSFVRYSSEMHKLIRSSSEMHEPIRYSSDMHKSDQNIHVSDFIYSINLVILGLADWSDSLKQTIDTAVSVLLSGSDPLLVKIDSIINEKIKEQNDILNSISKTCIEVYKYGRQIKELELLIKKYNKIEEEYNIEIKELERKRGRDYNWFKHNINSIDYCMYYHDSKLREELQQFNDLFDIILISRWQENRCIKCGDTIKYGLEKEYANLLYDGIESRVIGNEYARLVYERRMGLSVANTKYERVGRYVIEGVLNKCSVNAADGDACINRSENGEVCINNCTINCADGFADRDIDIALQCVFSSKSTALAIDTREYQVVIGSDMAVPALLANESIFANPEYLINLITDQNTNGDDQTVQLADQPDLLYFYGQLTDLYKSTAIFNFDHNYNYFIYLIYTKLDESVLEQYFADANVYEFIDRIWLAEEYLKLLIDQNRSNGWADWSANTIIDKSTDTVILYNSILKFKVFRILEMNDKKLKETKRKLHKSPHHAESIIREYTDQFLLMPIISFMQINIEIPKCDGRHEWGGPALLSGMLEQASKSKTGHSNKISSIGNNNKISIVGNNNKIGDVGHCSATDECSAWLALARSLTPESISSISSLINSNNFASSLINFNNFVGNFNLHIPVVPFSYNELYLASIIYYISDLYNINKNSNDILINAISYLINYGMKYQYPPYLYFIYCYSNLMQIRMEKGDGIKEGKGNEIKEEEIEEEIEGGNKEEDGEINSEGNEAENNGKGWSVSEEDGDSGVDGEEIEGNEEKDEKERGGENEASKYEEKERTREDGKTEEEGTLADQDEDSGDQSTDQSSCVNDQADQTADQNSDQNSNETDQTPDQSTDQNSEPSDALTDQNSDHLGSAEYACKPAAVNHNQTCNIADGYNSVVVGDDLNVDALHAGDGNECVDGTDNLLQSADKPVCISSTRINHVDVDASKLVELLRIVLSNKLSKYKGEYKTGKKLNMKRIVQYIASDYRKDKIWMRRDKDDKNNYKIRIFIDNSKSMYNCKLIKILSSVYSKLSKAFAALEVPVQVFRFGNGLAECKIEDLDFRDEKTEIGWIEEYKDGINLILTDGMVQGGVSRMATSLLVILDKGELKKMKRVSMVDGKIFVEGYLDTLHMKYCVISEIEEVEQVFVMALAELISML